MGIFALESQSKIGYNMVTKVTTHFAAVINLKEIFQ